MHTNLFAGFFPSVEGTDNSYPSYVLFRIRNGYLESDCVRHSIMKE